MTGKSFWKRFDDWVTRYDRTIFISLGIIVPAIIMLSAVGMLIWIFTK